MAGEEGKTSGTLHSDWGTGPLISSVGGQGGAETAPLVEAMRSPAYAPND